MDLGHTRAGGVEVLVLPVPRLDADNTPDFKEALAALDFGGGPLVADLSRVEFIDSMGIGALLGCMRRQHGRGSTFRLCGVQPTVEAVFQILNLHRVFEIYETRGEAIAG